MVEHYHRKFRSGQQDHAWNLDYRRGFFVYIPLRVVRDENGAQIPYTWKWCKITHTRSLKVPPCNTHAFGDTQHPCRTDAASSSGPKKLSGEWIQAVKEITSSTLKDLLAAYPFQTEWKLLKSVLKVRCSPSPLHEHILLQSQQCDEREPVYR